MRITMIILAAALFAACGPSPHNGGDDAGGSVDGNGDCSPGAKRCTGNTLETCENGTFVTSQECPMACDTSLGCVVCQPGTGTCNGDTSHACLPDGSGYYDEYCDPVMGSACDPSSGICVGPCSAYTLGQTYIGCDYYAVTMSQLVNPSFQFAVAVSNTSGAQATVTIDGGALGAPITFQVGPGAVGTQYLPWVPTLKTCNTQGGVECGAPEQYGALAVGGAYHVRSDEPVTVYQFSPLDYTNGSGFSYSNDASLLLPTNAWTGNYVTASWQAWDTGFAGVMPGTLDVTAQQDGTMVTVVPRADTTGGNGAPSFSAGAGQTIAMNKGDVLQLMTQTGDLSGSTVTADKPVQVMGGHHCTQVPIGYTACDHVEESIFPLEALSDSYIVTAPLMGGSPREEMVRVIATTANTTVTLDPAVGGPYTLANVGDMVEIPQQAADFAVTADHKILVSQFMESQDAPGGSGTGDPAMTLAVPVDQYRVDYQFHAPTNYDGGNYVNITAPTGVSVQLDGVAVDPSAYTAIGASGFGVARVALSNSGNGTHTASSAMPFGISVYGYGQYTSYWYPGGLDLSSIPVE